VHVQGGGAPGISAHQGSETEAFTPPQLPWHALSINFLLYVILGCDDTHPCRGRYLAFGLGVCRNAGMVGQRIVCALGPSLYRGSLARMKRRVLLQFFCNPRYWTRRPYKQSFENTLQRIPLKPECQNQKLNA